MSRRPQILVVIWIILHYR